MLRWLQEPALRVEAPSGEVRGRVPRPHRPPGYTRLLRSAVAWGCLTVAGLGGAQGQPQDNPWRRLDQLPKTSNASRAWVKPDRFRSFELDHNALQSILKRAPKEFAQPVKSSEAVIALPMPDGRLARFRFVESPVMAPELAARFPQIKTYAGQGMDDPQASVRFDSTPAGFHAQILSPQGAAYIDPHLRGDTNLHAVYYKRDYRRPAGEFQCLTSSGESASLAPAMPKAATVSGGSLRSYRLACAATGEYTQFHGGTISAGLAAMVTAINRVMGVYESELAIRLVLVANNDRIVYTNASTDPYSNNNPALLLSQNQSNLDAVIGSANYDIGHVFGTAGGGLASLGVVGVDGRKAQGETGMASPVGDAFYIDYVAHEMGHQFGAHHTFNSNTGSCGGAGRNAATACEPGSGSTIMAYAGICGADNLQAHSDPYFHSVSLDEITAYITSGTGGYSATVTTTGNDPPAIVTGSSFTLPKNTPFTLTAQGSDPNGDTLTYCWEERDLGPATALAAADNGSSPLFRSFAPTANPVRTFPQPSAILNHTVPAGETLPTTARTLQFRVTARDNRAGGGGLGTSDTQVTVTTNAGPFVITAPTSTVTWSGLRTVTWDVAGTTNPPISAASVNILLSTNGGLDFPILLAANVPNSGAQDVLLPDLSTAAARIKVEAAGNIFFDISPTNFAIVPAVQVVMSSSTNAAKITVRDNLSATPYPSMITVAGVTGTVTKVTVTLRGLTHTCPADLDVLLVGPGGQNVLLISDAGTNKAVSNLTLTFDDTAATLPQTSTLASGTYRPTNFDTNTDLFPAPAPTGPFGSALSSVFNGLNPNGTWSLFVRDDKLNNTGSITQGWTLAITTSISLGSTNFSQPPVLAPIADRRIHAGSTLTVANSATTPDGLTSTLSFSLGPDAPPTASINATNGLLRWATAEADATATNRFTVRVTDERAPALADAKSFTVTVLPPPAIGSLTRSDGAMTVTWSAIAGQSYRVQYTDTLPATNWHDLAPDITATGPTAAATDSTASVPQRFYRLVVLP